MDFSWTQQQSEMYTNVLHFAREHFQNAQPARHWTREQWRQCGNGSLLGLCVPEQYGGSGYNAQTTALAIEAFGQGCADTGLVFSVAAHLLACTMPIAEYGSYNLKSRWLPGLCSGELVGANAITEKEAGSDIFALKAQAVRKGEHYLLSGIKSYVSNGPLADLFLVYASTNPSHGHMGITCFLIERQTPGLSTTEPLGKLGLTSTPACQVIFNESAVPVTNRLGEEGQGSLIFKRSMQWERACLFALYLGQMERQLKQTATYAHERHQFGKPIYKQQAVAHRLADMKLRLEAARLLLYRACWLFDQGQDATLAVSLSKLAVSEAAIQGGLDAIRIHGSVGIDTAYGIERMMRDAIPGSIFSGTSDIMREIIAGELNNELTRPGNY